MVNMISCVGHAGHRKAFRALTGILYCKGQALLAALLLISCSLVAPLFQGGTAAAASFTDMPSSHWAYSSVEKMASRGITKGCGADVFCPNEAVSRGVFATFLIRTMYGDNFTYVTTPYFTDVAATDWRFKYVQKLKELNITLSSGTFQVDDLMTRDQLAAFTTRALNQTTTAWDCYYGAMSFTDVDTKDILCPNVLKIKEMGITAGCGTNLFCPKDTLTRAMVAVFLDRSFLSGISAICSATPSSGLVPLTTTISADNVTGGLLSTYTYSWNLNDNNTTSTAKSSSHTYNYAGTYNPSATITNGHYTTTCSVPVTVTSNPLSVSCTASPTSGTAPVTVSFTGSATGGTGPLSYSWAFGAGGGTSNTQNPSKTFNTAGGYVITLSVTDGVETKTCNLTVWAL